MRHLHFCAAAVGLLPVSLKCITFGQFWRYQRHQTGFSCQVVQSGVTYLKMGHVELIYFT